MNYYAYFDSKFHSLFASLLLLMMMGYMGPALVVHNFYEPATNKTKGATE